MDCMIAFDVGGTKTDAVLFDSTGHVLRRSVTPGANPLDVGFDEACRRYLPADRQPGFHQAPDGEPFYFIPNPALGLWMCREEK